MTNFDFWLMIWLLSAFIPVIILVTTDIMAGDDFNVGDAGNCIFALALGPIFAIIVICLVIGESKTSKNLCLAWNKFCMWFKSLNKKVLIKGRKKVDPTT